MRESPLEQKINNTLSRGGIRVRKTNGAIRMRKTQIRQMVAEQGSLSIQNLAQHFKVSEMTIRRDLEDLESDGQVRRSYGGVVTAEEYYFEYDYYQRRSTHRDQKIAIAEEAVRLIKPRHRIMIDSGSTTLELARQIRKLNDLIVITNSMAAATILQSAEGIQTYLLGCAMRRGLPDLNGPMTEKMLDMFTVDIVFQGADGIDLDGWLYNDYIDSSHISSKMHEKSKHRFILADSSKIGESAFARFGSLRDGTTLITDSGIMPQHLQILKENVGADVRVVQVVE